ncbi:MAG: carbohydrate ABC transporter permease [Actinomycetota bacterium]|jgi:multiple sugar transport system permease protein|nr:carbohydrate ABC transporter permease [Actinomycetota bacterium]
MAVGTQDAVTGQQRSQRPAPTTAGGGAGKAVLTYVLLILLSIVFIAPLLWMVSTSLKSQQAATQSSLQPLPEEVDTTAYETITRPGTDTPVVRWFLNSMVAASAHAILVVAIAAPAAYALARMQFRGKRLVYGMILATLFIPPIIFLMPNFDIVSRLGWLDTLFALIIPPAAGAFGVFFLRQFFSSLPVELEEAARVDGAKPWQIFARVIVPLSKPALSTLLLLSFLTNWNDFLWPVYVMFSPERLTLPPGLSQLQGAYTINYPVVMAGGVIASIPVLLLYVVAQRYIIEGVSRSGIKG